MTDAAPQKADPLMGRDGIATRIPHAGSMCLLDRLLAWDDTRIVCEADSHRSATNPLRSAGGLRSGAAIEYAAQAMALHGALLGERAQAALGGSVPEPPRPGFLASARGVDFSRWRLDDLAGPLRIEVVRQAGDAQQILYQFSVRHGDEMLASGRAAVVLNTPIAPTVPPAPT
ncbi:3-hydroxylacyl-ACP dehydratase [Leptothrix discophora]|uniref:3-hydroxylacyl-ACP dehydratase n=1 Tax=Leptothrix discophora TaxID=89 RepID=A0ABT9G8T8_LEPDI|nr:3-hydroxylacyl-ACP dehydratase [Leptothrix discophora]MDP4302909.1 3-hydroxylacyl-ACP dehydratase [Leptothrix discophora]